MTYFDEFWNDIFNDVMSGVTPSNEVVVLGSIKDAFAIKNVIYNDPATIVYWEDGTKTVVKANNEKFDKEKGLAMCFAKKAMGNKGNYFEAFKKWADAE